MTGAPPSQPGPPRALARLLRLLAALLLAAAAAAALPPAQAQTLDYGTLLGAGGGEGEDAPLMSRPGGDPDRPADLAAYGALEDYDAGGTMVRRTTESVSVFRQRLERMLSEAREGPAQLLDRLSAAAPDGDPGYFAGVALVCGILILIGRAVVQLFAVYVFRPVMISAQRALPPDGISGKLPILALRMGLTVVALAINLAVALGLGLWLVETHPPTQATAGILLVAYSAYMLVDTAWRMVLSPYLSDYRIPRISDAAARRLYIWLSAAAFVAVVGTAWVMWLREIGASAEFVRLNAIGVSFVGLVIVLALVWRERAGITSAILHGRPRAEASRVAAFGARIWAPLVTLYFLAAWLEETFRNVMGKDRLAPLLGGAFATLMLALVVQGVGLYVIERIYHPGRGRRPARTPPAAGPVEAAEVPAPAAAAPEAGGPLLRAAAPPERTEPPAAQAADIDGDGEEEGGGPAGAPAPAAAPPRRAGLRSYEDLARRVLTLFSLGAAAWLLALIWGGREIFAEGSLFDRWQGVIDILLIGYIAYHAVRIWLDRRIAEEGADDIAAEPGDEGGGASAVSRLGTLLPLFRSAILITIGVSVALAAATELGVNVAPLFAGAGIVGIAVGFGAQTLVRDILSGMFFLLDDAFRKGEYIDVGEVKGTVEKISLRSFQLRHHLGALHTIPFGEIKHLTNYSRDWVMMKLPLRLTYDTDVEKVRKLIKKLGQRLLEHETEGRKFVQPLKSQGVIQMDDSAMIVRVKYMTRPGDQWTTRKLVYKEIRDLFEQEGIRFAHREVTVRIPDLDKGGEGLSDEERRAVGAAARRAVDQAEEEGPPAGPMAAAEMR